jgi:hypothetical protein
MASCRTMEKKARRRSVLVYGIILPLSLPSQNQKQLRLRLIRDSRLRPFSSSRTKVGQAILSTLLILKPSLPRRDRPHELACSRGGKTRITLAHAHTSGLMWVSSHQRGFLMRKTCHKARLSRPDLVAKVWGSSFLIGDPGGERLASPTF